MPYKNIDDARESYKKYENSENGKKTRKKYKSSEKGKEVSKKSHSIHYKKTKMNTDYYICGNGKFSSIRTSARSRNVSFSLTKDELRDWWNKTPDICEYCSMTLEDFRKFRDIIVGYNGTNQEINLYKPLFGGESRKNIDCLSIDRKDSAKGYELQNMAKCCYFCNMIKHRFISHSQMHSIGPTIIKNLKMEIDKEFPHVESDEKWFGKLGYFNQTFIKKNWGFEQWIWNNSRYCGKLLHFHKNKKLSWHFHEIKDETFCLGAGSVIIKYGLSDDISLATDITLNKGDSFHIPPGLRHQVIALEDSDLYEFSTQHFDEDSIRIIKGD